MRTTTCLGLAALLPALCALALLPTHQAAAAPATAKAAVRTLEFERVEGRLVALDGEHVTLKDEGGADRRLALDTAVSMELPAGDAPRGSGTYVRAWLTGGSRLVARIVGGAEDLLRLESPSLGSVELLLDHVATLEALPATADPCLDLARKHPRPDEGDIAYDTDGDELRGSVLSVDDKGIAVETAGARERRVAWNDLRVLHLENERPKPAPALHAELELQDGSRLRTHAAPRLEGETLAFALHCTPKQARRLPLAQVRAVRWYGGRFVYASDLPFESTYTMLYETPAEQTMPALNERWLGARVDRRSDGCPLRVDGRTFRHGFGVNSKSTITIRLDGAYESFRTWFGIDDGVLHERGAAKSLGNVDARILGDGKVLWEAKDVEGGQKARRVGPLDVKGVKALVLEVGFGALRPGEIASTRDRADWGDPILVKQAR